MFVRPSKKGATREASRTTPFTLNVSLNRRATNFPTFPEAPMTATVSPGCNWLEDFAPPGFCDSSHGIFGSAKSPNADTTHTI
eukprot:scaffold169004_cov42-Attheya_sp.AAC.1